MLEKRWAYLVGGGGGLYAGGLIGGEIRYRYSIFEKVRKT